MRAKERNQLEEKIDDLLGDPEEKRQAVTQSSHIYQFKITLKDSDPPIWRRIQVPDCSLGEFHETLQIVMGWEDCHLHQFIVRGEHYGPSDPEDADWETEQIDEEEMSISQVASTGQKTRFTYEYDFGDSWRHEILLEQILKSEPNVSYPRCIAGEQACPPEDVGGMSGYYSFLEAISDPEHEDHDDQVIWIDGEFDPEQFSVDKVNNSLGNFTEGRR